MTNLKQKKKSYFLIYKKNVKVITEFDIFSLYDHSYTENKEKVKSSTLNLNNLLISQNPP